MEYKKIREIEAKWRKKWVQEKAFESDPDTRGKFYLTVAYPYPSGAPTSA